AHSFDFPWCLHHVQYRYANREYILLRLLAPILIRPGQSSKDHVLNAHELLSTSILASSDSDSECVHFRYGQTSMVEKNCVGNHRSLNPHSRCIISNSNYALSYQCCCIRQRKATICLGRKKPKQRTGENNPLGFGRSLHG